jgi:hypothetical protein
MATTLENLVAARDGAAAKLAATLTEDYSDALEFKPEASGTATLNRSGYIRELRETIAFLDREISKHDAFEETSLMVSE